MACCGRRVCLSCYGFCQWGHGLVCPFVNTHSPRPTIEGRSALLVSLLENAVDEQGHIWWDNPMVDVTNTLVVGNLLTRIHGERWATPDGAVGAAMRDGFRWDAFSLRIYVEDPSVQTSETGFGLQKPSLGRIVVSFSRADPMTIHVQPRQDIPNQVFFELVGDTDVIKFSIEEDGGEFEMTDVNMENTHYPSLIPVMKELRTCIRALVERLEPFDERNTACILEESSHHIKCILRGTDDAMVNALRACS